MDYRSYSVGLDGHFIRFDGFVCANDEAAIEEAKRYVVGHDIELWCSDRFVARIDHKPKKGAYEPLTARAGKGRRLCCLNSTNGLDSAHDMNSNTPRSANAER